MEEEEEEEEEEEKKKKKKNSVSAEQNLIEKSRVAQLLMIYSTYRFITASTTD
jgi:hypothetical protein